MKQLVKIIVLSFTIGLCLLAASCASGSSQTKKINIEDYIEIVFDENDYNGYATPEIVINEEALDKAANVEALDEFNTKNEFTFGWEYFTLSNVLQISLSENYDNLSNGDVIYIIVQPDSSMEMVNITELEQLEAEIGIRIASDTIKYTVKDLKDISEVSVKLESLVDIDFGKYNGYGTPQISINANALNNAINSDIYNAYITTLSSDLKTVINGLNNRSELFEITLKEPYNNTSNGDKIYYSITINKKLAELGMTIEDLCQGIALNLESTEVFETAEGLKAVDGIDLIDLFADIESHIEISGPDGNGAAKAVFEKGYRFSDGNYYMNYNDNSYSTTWFEIVRNNEYITSFGYRFDEGDSSNLTKGDIITITISIDSTSIAQNGVDVASMRYNVLVGENDLGEYLHPEDLNDASLTERIKECLIRQDKYSQEFYDLYLQTITPGTVNKYNTPYAVIGIGLSDNGWYSRYYYYILHDVFINPDGTISGTFTKKTCSGKTLEDARQALNDSESYTYEKID